MTASGKAEVTVAIDRLMAIHALGARVRRAEQVAEWERLEAEDEAAPGFRCSLATRWNGECLRGRPRATEPPTEAESEALLAYEREHLGIDRLAGTLRKLGDV